MAIPMSNLALLKAEEKAASEWYDRFTSRKRQHNLKAEIIIPLEDGEAQLLADLLKQKRLSNQGILDMLLPAIRVILLEKKIESFKHAHVWLYDVEETKERQRHTEAYGGAWDCNARFRCAVCGVFTSKFISESEIK